MSVDSDNIVAVLIPEEIKVLVEDIPKITLNVDKEHEIVVISSGSIGSPGPAGPQGVPGPLGPAGPPGPTGAGSMWYTSEQYSEPWDVPNPKIGDQYLTTYDGDVYSYVGPPGGDFGLGWERVANIMGPHGSYWYTSYYYDTPEDVVDPGSRDQWLDLTTGDVWEYNTEVQWEKTGNIKGPVGPQGPKGDVGNTGPAGPAGPQGPAGTGIYMKGSVPNSGALPPTGNTVGDAYVATDTNHLWVWDGTKWVDSGNIQGPQGPAGPTGATGAQGTPGEKWFTGSGVPAGALGSVADWYLDSSNGDYYEKTAAATWTMRGNLRGPKGDTGAQGVQGAQGPAGATGATGATGQAEGWYADAGPPQLQLGNIGDFYLETSTGNVYEKTAPSVWSIRGNIKGPKGDTGAQGPQGATGANGPAGATGPQGTPGEVWYSSSTAPVDSPVGTIHPGDWWLNPTDGNYYDWAIVQIGPPVVYGWVPRGNLKGPQGTTGATGSQGPAGTNGEKWFAGAGVPAGSLAGSVVNDWYLDTVTGDIYEKTGASAWTQRGNIKGPSGEKWSTGSGAPGSGVGSQNDWYLDSANGDFYEKTGASTWTLRGNLKGPQGNTGAQGTTGATGSQGPTGAAGSKWYTGSGTPDVVLGSTGAVGDFYLDSSTSTYWEKNSPTTWVSRGNIKGNPGERWFSGTGTPTAGNTSGSNVGDWYLNLSDGMVWEKTDPTTWVGRGSIKGPTGAQGPPGTTQDLAPYQTRSEKGAASGYAPLDSASKLPKANVSPGTVVVDSDPANDGGIPVYVAGYGWTTTQYGEFELTANKGDPNGYPSLDASGKVPASQLPAASGGGGTTVDVKVFTASGTWTKPSGVKTVQVIVIGAGGGGGGGFSAAISNAARGGSGGGGGGVAIGQYNADDLRATEPVIVAAAAAGSAGGSAAQATPGGYSEFGDGTSVRLRANGGGAGYGAASGGSGNVGAGGGGSTLGQGSSAVSGGIGAHGGGRMAGVGLPGTGGSAGAIAGVGGVGSIGGGGGGSGAAGGSGEYGGGGGGGGSDAGAAGTGGNSVYGPGGGGGGSLRNASNVALAAGAGGGSSALYTQTGDGGAAGTGNGGAGGNGAAGSPSNGGMGDGGGGGSSGTTAGVTGGKGGDGGVPGGGGGGGGGGNPGGAGGAGARGQVVVISW